jgi:hypothetical protein
MKPPRREFLHLAAGRSSARRFSRSRSALGSRASRAARSCPGKILKSHGTLIVSSSRARLRASI